MRKVSIIITHYNRKDLLIKTIRSISKFESSKYAEFVIVDDASDESQNIDNIPNLFSELDIQVVKIGKDEKWWSCPCPTINKGVSESTGEIIILQGAEIAHAGDIISDVQRINDNQYFVYGCLSLKESENSFVNSDISKIKGDMWYQHSVQNPRCYNFCTAITRDDYYELGGFDERFGDGIAYGDDDFIRRVRLKGMDVMQIDNPHTLHQYHPPMQAKPTGNSNISDKELFDKINATEHTYKVKSVYLTNNPELKKEEQKNDNRNMSSFEIIYKNLIEKGLHEAEAQSQARLLYIEEQELSNTVSLASPKAFVPASYQNPTTPSTPANKNSKFMSQIQTFNKNILEIPKEMNGLKVYCNNNFGFGNYSIVIVGKSGQNRVAKILMSDGGETEQFVIQ